MPPSHFEERLAAVITAQRELYEPLANAAQRQVEEARSDGDLAIVTLRLALCLDELSAFASHPTRKVAFKIDPLAWNLIAQEFHNAEKSIEESVFALDPQKYEPQQLEQELANRPLFIRTDDANHWLRVTPPSAASKKSTGFTIVLEHQQSGRSGPMVKSDFIALMQNRLPALSKTQAEKIWAEVVPPEWRQPGRRTQS